MIFETHAHYDDKMFDEDRESLLESMQEAGIGRIVNIGADLASTASSIALAEKYPFIYAAAGVHPSDAAQLNEHTFQWLSEQTAHEKVVAVGEIGLDYYWEKDPEVRANQRYWFRRQLNLAREKVLPVSIHSRDAAKDTLDIAKEEHLAEIGGVVSIEESRRTTVKTVNVVNQQTGETKSYQLASSSGIRVKDGEQIEQGHQLNEGALNPHDILRVLNPRAVQDYLIKEVQKVYRQQGVDLNDKHIEVIVRQLMRKIKVEDAGDTDLLPGAMLSILELEDENEKVQARLDAGETGLEMATFSPVLMGITKAALATDSFLSAASFQETTRVLTDAAIKGKIDPLTGLKENVLIGKLIPAGSGLKDYREGHYEEIHNLD